MTRPQEAFSQKRRSRIAEKGAPTKARPFLKWAGGKQQLLSQFEPLFPIGYRRYIEPFVGGGAVFFHLWNTGRLPGRVRLLDNNPVLTNAYQVVKNRVDDLIAALEVHRRRHSQDYYYKIRNQDRRAAGLDGLQSAARTLYLNKTCFNGLYRVNRKGHFNVPVGSYRNPQIFDEVALRATSRALKAASIATRDFRSLVKHAEPGDFYYFDPPYDPVSKTASFTSYTHARFDDEDQQALAEVFAALSEKGCYCMLSNSHTPFILDLYRQFRIETVTANRCINSKGNRRGGVKEIVALNY